MVMGTKGAIPGRLAGSLLAAVGSSRRFTHPSSPLSQVSSSSSGTGPWCCRRGSPLTRRAALTASSCSPTAARATLPEPCNGCATPCRGSPHGGQPWEGPMPSALLLHPPRRAARSPGTRSGACPPCLCWPPPQFSYPPHLSRQWRIPQLGVLGAGGQQCSPVQRGLQKVEGAGTGSPVPLDVPSYALRPVWERPHLQPLLVVTEK